MLRTTPLNAVHRASSARMVDFGGWDMPVHYGSQIEEHNAVRQDAGIFDVSHMRVVDLEGADARGFLRRALANNIDKAKAPGKAIYSCLLNEEGGVIDDLIAYFFREDWFRLVVNAGTAEKDIAWLESLKGRWAAALAITPRADMAMIAIQGPNARARYWSAFPAHRAATEPLTAFTAALQPDAMVARTGYTGEDGFEVVVPAGRAESTWNALVAAGAKACGLGARDPLRLEAGMNLYGQDMDEKTSPLDAGLAWTVDLKSPRDFVGRGPLERDGKRHEFLGLVLESGGGVLRAHQKTSSARGAGEVTSGTFSPTLSRSIALARLPLGTIPGDPVEVQVRDKNLPARVVKPPFVRNGRILLS